MSKVKVNLTDETTGDSGFLWFKRPTVKESRELEGEIQDVIAEIDLLELRLEKTKQMYSKVDSFEEMTKIEDVISSINKELSQKLSTRVTLGLSTIRNMFIEGELNGEVVTAENIESKISVGAITEISKSLRGGLVEANS